ncbi:MAG: hypothetical protein RTU30_04520 [Candidatus Thorarchaeota archaeon]
MVVYYAIGRDSALYKFATKKNREDVIALRWPKACLSCGTDVSLHVPRRYAIVGLFHDYKKTQVLVKLPGFFYICDDCTTVIDSAIDMNHDSLEKVATNLKEHPWTEFIELGRDGHVKIPEGQFKEKLQNANPDAWIKPKQCPLDELRQKMVKVS